MAVNVMVDLETFGVGRKAMPISIGAVKFDAIGVLERFHVGITPESAQRAGFRMDASTMLWWLDPERAPAWAAWGELEKFSITEALDGFAMWFGPEQLRLWGNGATFDNVILRDAYNLCGFEFPTAWWNDRCYRTVKSLCPHIEMERVGTHHSAVDDAESQALHLIALADHLGIEL